jgi:hypothetical protein
VLRVLYEYFGFPNNLREIYPTCVCLMHYFAILITDMRSSVCVSDFNVSLCAIMEATCVYPRAF